MHHINATSTGVGNKSPAGHMWTTTVFSVPKGNIQEKSSNLKYPPIYRSKCQC